MQKVGFPAVRIFDFRRQSDLKQFVILAGGGKIAWMNANGTDLTVLSQGEDANAVWDFATNDFGLYGSNGLSKYRFVDTGNGLLTKFNWGIAAPGAAPTFTFAAGTLTLTEGRQYAFSWVSKWTDALGVTRVHVGPPSPLTGTTGPQLNEVVNLANLQASADAQVTHLWIWATNDTPLNTTSVLFFLAELTNGTTTYGDSLADTSSTPRGRSPMKTSPRRRPRSSGNIRGVLPFPELLASRIWSRVLALRRSSWGFRRRPHPRTCSSMCLEGSRKLRT